MSDDFGFVKKVIAHYLSEEQSVNYDTVLENGSFTKALHERLAQLKAEFFDVRMMPNSLGVMVSTLVCKERAGEAPTVPKKGRKKAGMAPASLDTTCFTGPQPTAVEVEPKTASEAQFGPVIHQGYSKERLRTMVKRDLIPICVQYGIPDYNRQPPDVLRSLILQHQEKAAAGEQLKCQVTGYPSKNLVTVEENGTNYAVCPRVKEYIDVGWTVTQILEGEVQIEF